MSVSSKRRSTLQLTGEPRLWHDPSNLPYAAVRKVWWEGFWACILLLVLLIVVVAIVWVAIRDAQEKNRREHPPMAPALVGDAVPRPFGSQPSSNSSDAEEASSGTEVPTGPRPKPADALEPSGALPAVTPGDALDQAPPAAGEPPKRLAFRPASGRVEWLKPAHHAVTVGVCRRIYG